MKKLDRVFSRYIKWRDSVDGYASCITCKRVFSVHVMECGHYIGRGARSVRWDERNAHAQCIECNHTNFKSDEIHQRYREALIEKYGLDTVEELEQLKNKLGPSLEEKEELYKHYKSLT